MNDSNVILITIAPNGTRYRVLYKNEILVEACRFPEFDGARALVARGMSGRAEVWRPGATAPAMLIPDITVAAKWTIEESPTKGPRLTRWKSVDAISHADAEDAVAVLPVPVAQPPSEPKPANDASAPVDTEAA
jgi:hypothetical protein